MQGLSKFRSVFVLFINDLPDNVTCNVAIYAGNSTLFSACYQALDL